EARVLPRQDDECAQLGSSVSRWRSRSGPGTVVSLQRVIRLLEQWVLKGGLEVPAVATAASGFLSLASLRNATSGRGHALGCMVVSSLKIMHFSLFQTA